MIEISIYSPRQQHEWDDFVKSTKNATFLHFRNYMDYHCDRFNDCSLIATSGKKIIAVLPANRVEDTLYSHQGLSYGGWLVPEKHFDITDMIDVFDAMATFLPSIGIRQLFYKAIPYIYHSYPAQEDLHAIFRHNGELVVSNISTTIDCGNPLRFNENCRRAVKQALKEGITVSETDDFAPYWEILHSLLQSKYGVKPVHSLDEIELLHSRFPCNIRLFVGKQGQQILGGTLVYDTGCVAHAQYIATTQQGREMKVLPLIFKHLIEEVFTHARYFDFGISNEQDGRMLNRGLAMQKTGMGGRGIVYETYRLKF